MPRKQARRDYLKISKSKKRFIKLLKKAGQKQLNYIGKNLGNIAKIVENGGSIPNKCCNIGNYHHVYSQQRTMSETNTHAITNRTVSIAPPWVCSIVRGKAREKWSLVQRSISAWWMDMHE